MGLPERFDCAVALCCDRNYYHLALFMVWQIAHHNPHRRFDFIIATRDDLEVPDWARPLGLTIHRSGDLPPAAEAGRYRGSVAPLYRIMLARELQSRYRRILYLDCDMFVEGGDLNRLMEVDIGPHPIGAVLDAPFMYRANYQALEFSRLGWPAAPYANTGLQLIDTRAYVEQDVDRRSFDVCTTYPQAIIYTDQSLTNIALRGQFAQLAPCWNWQWNNRYPLLGMAYPIFLRHFIGTLKPDRRAGPFLDVRYNQAYREFLGNFVPELLPRLVPMPKPKPMTLKQLAVVVARHLMSQGQARDLLQRHADPFKALY